VETNALFRSGEIRPVHAGRIPDNVLPLVARHVYNQRNILKAALGTDISLALSSFFHDPLLEGISPADIERLLREMLSNTARYLPAGWFSS
jgi:alpha-galactosidase